MADPRYLFEKVLFQAITPIHVGSGQDVGLVDLPVIRERTTGHPFLPGSGIRGALRNRCEAKNAALTRRLFGDDSEAEISSGCLSVLDAHPLLFPVRSVPGLFCWITSPFVIERYRRLCVDLTGTEAELSAPPASPPAEGTCLGGPDDALYLEEYRFERTGDSWQWNLSIDGIDPYRVILLNDTDFLHFVRYATIVRQRNRLSTAKTVLEGHLFSVESLPAESWFYGFLGATEERPPQRGPEEEDKAGERMPKEEVAQALRCLLTGDKAGRETHLTLGGDESVGLGVTRLRWLTEISNAGEAGP